MHVLVWLFEMLQEAIDCLLIHKFGLFDHDDILHPSALFKYREAIDEGADYIYCDEATFTDGDINKMITVHLMMKLKINYNYI